MRRLDQPIDYQIGDVIEPVDQRYVNFKSKVLDITEKGIVVQFLGYDVAPFTISHHDSHLMIKSKVGTVLYGNKDKKHSQG